MTTPFTAVLFPVNGPAKQVMHNQEPKKKRGGGNDSDALLTFMRKQIGGGYVEPCREFEGNGKLLVLWGDDEGLLKGLPRNETFPQFRGPLLLTAMSNDGECKSCTLEDWEKSSK